MKNHSPTFDNLFAFHKKTNDFLFGFFTYDLKNEIEKLSSSNADGLNFPSFHFFQPRYIFIKKSNEWQVGYLPQLDSEESIDNLINELTHSAKNAQDGKPNHLPVNISPRVSKPDYIRNVSKIKSAIGRGDVYEMNYCVEFFAENTGINPAAVFQSLQNISPMPFSCYYKLGDLHVLCASPERFIAKRGSKIISQPIKGTAPRGKSPQDDAEIKQKLFEDEKERSENVMIVDLVRNDLSRTASKGSVVVEKLFDIQTFRQLHQMVSTVVSEVKPGIPWTDVIKNAFPMGSMTGAPKIRAMQLIEEFEQTRRGLYSGAIGYVTPEADFDFNVVIRSIQYNEASKYLSFMVGSAITAGSDPEREYEECMLKAESMIKALS